MADSVRCAEVLWPPSVVGSGGMNAYVVSNEVSSIMSQAREKLNEARFFLTCMARNPCDRDAFKYNLSAFLSAARSVLWFMRREFKKADGFQDWYDTELVQRGWPPENQRQGKQGRGPATGSDPVLTLLVNQRDITIHERPVELRGDFSASLSTSIPPSTSVSFVVMRGGQVVQRGGSEPAPTAVPQETTASMECQWYFHDLPDKDVVAACSEYLAKLDQLITDCEVKFSI